MSTKTLLLPVPLTDAEKLVLLDELSLMISEHESLEEQKKALPEKIKNLEASLHLKNHAKKNGYIERDIEVREEPNAFAAKVKIFRVDTGEFVKERDMDPEEAQMQLGQSSVPGPAPDNVRSLEEARERTDEQQTANTPEEAEEQRAERMRADEIERLAADQAADDATGPKRLLKAPKKLKIQDKDGAPLPPTDPDAPDLTPPDGAAF